MEVRIDKYLWAIRIFKTRSIAAEACKKSRIMIDNKAVKPSRNIREGEVIQVKRPPVIYSYLVTQLLDRRQSAKIVVDYYKDVTPQDELSKLDVKETFYVKREKGAGRPTKRDRRDLEKLMDLDD